MKTSRLTSTLFLSWIVALAFCAVRTNAQTEPRPLSPDRVTFYSEPNFKGDALTVEAGATVESLDRMRRPNQQPWTFAISSVLVEGAAKAIVYSAPGLRGERLEITRSIADLYGERREQQPGTTWDRSIVSLSVVGPQRVVVTPAPAHPEPPTTVYVVPAPQPPVVHEVRPALSYREAEAIVQHAYREVLNRAPDPDGLRRYRDRLMREGWTEKQLIEQLQRSGEARSINADEAITRMYREVLGRDPDAHGLNHYREKWRDGWTQGQIRTDLERSPEGRQAFIRNAITRAYRELLGRDPDPVGYANYERLMRDRGLTERQLREAIMSGDEYRQRRGRR